jgi:hypothetical protein
VLVVKKQLVKNSIPAVVGGGTVLYVTPQDHRYLDDLERREEGGTPAIVESIRAGLVFKLQREVGLKEIERREHDFVQRAMDRLSRCSTLEILGSLTAPRLSILSLRFRHGTKDLHYGFVVALLNDLFGIQVRGGCSCAGPYGHSLLNISMDHSRALEREIRRGAKILRPGWVRLNFNYFIDEEEFEYLLRAIELVAQLGWRMLPFYQFEPAAGVWRYQGQPLRLKTSLQDWTFADLPHRETVSGPEPLSLAACGDAAEAELRREFRSGVHYALTLSEESERLCWFLLPQEAATELSQQDRQDIGVKPTDDRVAVGAL